MLALQHSDMDEPGGTVLIKQLSVFLAYLVFRLLLGVFCGFVVTAPLVLQNDGSPIGVYLSI